MLRNVIESLAQGAVLSQADAHKTMEAIMGGEATAAQIGGILIALRLRGETPAEITGFARAMRQAAEPFTCKGELADTCGTGGDGAGTFNISTTVAFVVAACGLPVAKHGNRAITSKCGSADLLAALGVEIDLNPHQVAWCIEEAGMGFLFAPTFHRAMRHAAGPRRELGIRTVFNLLGPLTNPAAPTFQALGVWDGKLVRTVAEVLQSLGVKGAMVFHGAGGLDELSLAGENIIAELENGSIREYSLLPQDLGFEPAPLSAVRGGDPHENASITLEILSGQRGPKRDVVLLNAAALLKVSGRAKSWQEAIAMAGEAIDTGRALERLEALKKAAREVKSRALRDCRSKTQAASN